MTLAEKGPVQSPPTLTEPLEAVSRTVQSWPGVAAYVHWHLYHVGELIDGTDFNVDGDEQELGHLHLDGDLHLATPVELSGPLVAAGLARSFPYGGAEYAGWTAYRVRSAANARHSEWLLRLNYDYLRGTPLPELLARVAAYAA